MTLTVTFFNLAVGINNGRAPRITMQIRYCTLAESKENMQKCFVPLWANVINLLSLKIQMAGAKHYAFFQTLQKC